MDPVTHAASGAVALLALPHRPATRWAAPLAALAAAAPDVDMLFAHTPLQFLLLHRGITHSLVLAPLLGLALALLARPLRHPATPGRWSLGKVWLFMLCMVLMHIWLDCITTYGTLIFVPFSHLRVRLNAVFIIDFLLTLPLLWAIWRWRTRRGLMLLALAWIFVYPGLALALNARLTTRATQGLAAEGRHVSGLTVLPDAFAPLFWRVLYAEEGPQGTEIHSQGLDALGRAHSPATSHAALPPALMNALARQSVVAEAFFQFTLLPVMSPLPNGELPPDAAPQDAPGYMLAYDLRFGSNLELVRKILAKRPHAGIPFAFMAEIAPAPDGTPDRSGNARLVRERLRFASEGRNGYWQSPRPPAQSPWWLWLVGLR